MKVLISTPSLTRFDAVGNDCIQQYNCLKGAGIETRLYAENYEKDFKAILIPEKDLSKFLSDENVLLIYHHSIFWEKGLELFSITRGKRVLKYHNITPAHFFIRYSAFSANICHKARAQNYQFYKAGIDMLWGDSLYNNKDFLNLGLVPERQRILPPFHNLGQEISADVPLLQKLSDGKTNVLFVGRVVPNKGHIHIMKTAQYFRTLFGTDVRFVIVGALDKWLGRYYQELGSTSSGLGLNEIVNFTGRVTEKELKAYYLGAHVFIIMSEHEGFCVPILEAQQFRVPIVALNRCAVKETLGENQIGYDDINYETFASAIETIRKNADMRLYLAEEGVKNLERFSYETTKSAFLGLVRELI